MSEGTVGGLIKKLRAMHGHLSAKDKTVCVECIGALTDLSLQLWNATHPGKDPVYRAGVGPKRGGFELRKVPDAELDGAHPDGTPVLEDTDGSSVR